MAQLVCEGACNPHLGALDEAVRLSLLSDARKQTRHREGLRDQDVIVPVDADLAAELRRVVHTSHVPATRPMGDRVVLVPHTWACQVCGHQRAWT